MALKFNRSNDAVLSKFGKNDGAELGELV